MRVVRNSRDGGWNDSAEVDGDIKTDGGPVSITGLNCFLVLAHGVDLNISLAFTNERRALPGYHIFDVVIVEATENDDVTTEKWLVAPADWVNVNAVVYASEHALRVNGTDNGVVNLPSSTIPVGLEVLLWKGSWDYLVAVKVVDRC
jgi:hypothetical protein